MKNIKRGAFIGALAIFFSGVISCEKDFKDLKTKVISNTKFSTGELIVDITVENDTIKSVPTDNITLEPGQYLLGVYASSEYEKIEASIVSQLAITSGLALINSDTIAKYETATSHIVTSIDTVFIKLPYQATLDNNTSSGPEYTLDSIIGNQSEPFTLNVYQMTTFLSRLHPVVTSKLNSYNSKSFLFENAGTLLNDTPDFQFKPNANDTTIVISRRTNTGVLVTKDTILFSNSTVPYPFARIPLNEDTFKELFLDKYGDSDFDSQYNFNRYFRGVNLEARGANGSLISFNFSNTATALNPSIEVYYTNTVLETATNDTIKTFRKNDSFSLSGIRAATYKMEEKTYPTNEQVIIQGTAGSEVKINLFGADTNGDGIPDKLKELRDDEILINDASLTFYIDQSADISAIPYRLYLYKDDEKDVDDPNLAPNLSQIPDTETTFGGFLERAAPAVEGGIGKPEKYTFKITDYVSKLVNSETDYSPTLKLKVFNTSDFATTDTIFRHYNWNPKAVTLFNHAILGSNENKRAQLKISYSKSIE